jgi:hypothetical protein
MPPAALYRRHDAASQAKYQEIKQLARSQSRVLSGTPGTLKQRTQSGRQYWVREHIRVDGKKDDEYIGPAAASDAAKIKRLREEIALAKALAAGSAQLRLFGYQRIDRKPAAVLEVLFNSSLFDAGLAVVGSHAYGALLNELGVLAPGYRTQDIDLARAQPLALALADGSSLESLLKETGLGFVPVPGMPSHKPSASFKLPGSERLAVDLLVPGTRTGEVIFDFLIDEPAASIALSPNQVIPIVVPSPERFLLHKLFSSQSRAGADRDKIRKDLQQTAVLAAALEEETPGRLNDAFRRMPRAGIPRVKRGAQAASKLLVHHPEAEASLLRIAGR